LGTTLDSLGAFLEQELGELITHSTSRENGLEKETLDVRIGRDDIGGHGYECEQNGVWESEQMREKVNASCDATRLSHAGYILLHRYFCGGGQSLKCMAE
jgi:hypothetical protein